MGKIATSNRPMARVSLKDSILLFRNIKNKPLEKAKVFLNELVEHRKNLEGKYYDGASKEILNLLKEAETNAESLGLDIGKLFVKEAQANKALTFILPKSRFRHRGRRAKICQLKITLEER